MREKIQEQLRRIEEAENIKILLSVESGSRAWGFASPDSDYDVRFIYIRRLEDYLRLDTNRDVIELPIDDVLDINGCLIRYKWNWEENKIHTSLNSYCTICGKINDKMKNSIVIDYMKKVDTPVGKRYIQISEDILYDTYHGRLPVFFVEDICKDKYVNLG